MGDITSAQESRHHFVQSIHNHFHQKLRSNHFHRSLIFKWQQEGLRTHLIFEACPWDDDGPSFSSFDPKNCGNKGSSSRTKKNLWLAPSKDGGMCRVALLCLLSSTFCCHFVMLKRAPYKHKRREALLICQTPCIELSILWKSSPKYKSFSFLYKSIH